MTKPLRRYLHLADTSWDDLGLIVAVTKPLRRRLHPWSIGASITCGVSRSDKAPAQASPLAFSVGLAAPLPRIVAVTKPLRRRLHPHTSCDGCIRGGVAVTKPLRRRLHCAIYFHAAKGCGSQ